MVESRSCRNSSGIDALTQTFRSDHWVDNVLLSSGHLRQCTSILKTTWQPHHLLELFVASFCSAKFCIHKSPDLVNRPSGRCQGCGDRKLTAIICFVFIFSLPIQDLWRSPAGHLKDYELSWSFQGGCFENVLPRLASSGQGAESRVTCAAWPKLETLESELQITIDDNSSWANHQEQEARY